MADELKYAKTPPSAVPDTPLGPFYSPATRKLLCLLIGTLNNSFPDYDFSHLRPDQFLGHTLEKTTEEVNRLVLNDVARKEPGQKAHFWKSIDDTVKLRECQIFSYIPDSESVLFVQGKLWSCNYFFYNKKAKQLVFFACIATNPRRSAHGDVWYNDDAANEMSEEEFDLNDDSEEMDFDTFDADADAMTTLEGYIDTANLDLEELGISAQRRPKRTGRPTWNVQSTFGSLDTFSYTTPPLRPLRAHSSTLAAASPATPFSLSMSATPVARAHSSASSSSSSRSAPMPQLALPKRRSFSLNYVHQ